MFKFISSIKNLFLGYFNKLRSFLYIEISFNLSPKYFNFYKNLCYFHLIYFKTLSYLFSLQIDFLSFF